MAYPYGNLIFECDNRYRFYTVQERKFRDWQEGGCSAVVAMWIRKCCRIRDDVIELSEIGTPLQVEIVQAARQRGSFNYQNYNEEESVLKTQNLRVVDKDVVHHTRLDWHKLLTRMVNVPGMYYVGLEHYDGGHVVGFRTIGNNLGYSCFDPNEGLFATRDGDRFIRKNTDYFLYDYMDCVAASWYLCELD